MTSTRGTELAECIIKALEVHPAIDGVTLAGSRARGDAGLLSDWDFEVKTAEFRSVAGSLPALVAPLEPLAQQWDRLSDHACYMLMLRGAVKVDLIFDEQHEAEPPWEVSRATLNGTDDHFWDWIIWLAAKDKSGKRELVEAELRKMHEHLLGPLGAPGPPDNIEQAVALYSAASGEVQSRLGLLVETDIGREVRVRLRGHGYQV